MDKQKPDTRKHMQNDSYRHMQESQGQEQYTKIFKTPNKQKNSNKTQYSTYDSNESGQDLEG